MIELIFRCSICFNFMGQTRKCVSLECSHSLCDPCLQKLIEYNPGTYKCPICSFHNPGKIENISLMSIMENCILCHIPSEVHITIPNDYPILSDVITQLKSLIQIPEFLDFIQKEQIFQDFRYKEAEFIEQYEVKDKDEVKEFMMIIQERLQPQLEHKNPFNSLHFDDQKFNFSNQYLKQFPFLGLLRLGVNHTMEAKVTNINKKRVIVKRNYYTAIIDDYLRDCLSHLHKSNIDSLHNGFFRSQFMLKIDIKDAYHSIKRANVEKYLQNDTFLEIYRMLNQFTDFVVQGQVYSIKEGLIVGYNSSPKLLTLIVKQIIDAINQQLGHRHIIYYMDDILIPLTTLENQYSDLILNTVKQCFNLFDLQINDDKTQILDLANNIDGYKFANLQFIERDNNNIIQTSKYTFLYKILQNGKVQGRLIIN